MQSSPCCLLSRLPKPTPWFIALLADITQVACAVRLEAPLSSPPLSEPPLSPHDECVPSAFASTAAVAARFERKGRGGELPYPFPFWPRHARAYDRGDRRARRIWRASRSMALSIASNPT